MSEQTVFEHLDELRRRLAVSLVALAVGAVLAYFFSDGLLAALLKPLGPETNPVYFFSPSEAFLLKLKISLFAGFVLASPVILNQLWLFLSPAFRKEEKKAVSVITAALTVLFLTGVLFCYYAVIPAALKFLLAMQTEFLRPMISATSYIDFVLGMLLAFGVAFNLPLFVTALAWSGVLNSRVIGHFHKHAIVLIFILAAILTPSPDIASQILLAGPLIALFELSVLAVIILERKHKGKIAPQAPRLP